MTRSAPQIAAPATLEAAREYVQRGWAVVPIPPGAKGPRIPGWQNLQLTEADLVAHFRNGENIGVILGTASGGLVDVDMDAPEAVVLGALFLPKTSMISGRASKPASHRWYLTQQAPSSEKFCDPDGSVLIELRSTGQQTLVPPSLHPSGEHVRWESRGEPARLSGEELRRAVRLVASAALLARHWPAPGRRNDAANALAGMLLRAGFSEGEVERLVAAIAEAAGDDEVRQRVRDVVSTAKRLTAGQPATGTPTLEQIVSHEVVRRVRDWLGLDPHVELTDARAAMPEWPAPLEQVALYGLAGDVVRALEPHTEADPVAILAQFLVLFGNVIGRRAHFDVEGMQHFGNLYVVLVGTTSKGRKGSSFAQVERLFEGAAPDWAKTRIYRGGLSSGEGVIWAVRDPIEKAERVHKRGEPARYEMVVTDLGVLDKRLLIFEPEFAIVLRVMEREGNTLSAIIREGWDSGTLASLTKNSPARATDAHISIIGHVTKEELLRYLTTTETASGFANRFLFLCVRRSKFLPEGSVVPDTTLAALRQRLEAAICAAQQIEAMQRDEQARAIWYEIYPTLSAGQPGLFGCVTARAEAQVLRLSMLYALLDGSAIIRREHLLAAVALWEFAENSARFIFGDALGDPTADQILKALRESPAGLSRTDISILFGRNRAAGDIERALRVLSQLGLARRETRQTGGRPEEVWGCT
jgi:hypothetical protein